MTRSRANGIGFAFEVRRIEAYNSFELVLSHFGDTEVEGFCDSNAVLRMFIVLGVGVCDRRAHQGTNQPELT